MLEIMCEIICAILYAILDFYIMKKILQSNEKIYTGKNIILLLLIAIIYMLSDNGKYSIDMIIIKTSFGVIANCIIFNSLTYKTIVSYIICMLLTLVADLINGGIYMATTSLISLCNPNTSYNFVPLSMVRTNITTMAILNITVAITIFIVLKTKILVTKLQQLVASMKEYSNMETIIFCTLVYTMIITVYYKITLICKWDFQNFINYIIIFISFCFFIIYTLNKLSYSKLLQDYDVLFNCVQELEETVDKKDINNHEQKNQLAILKNYIETNDKLNALDTISDMTDEFLKQDYKIITELKNIPNGGIKGLLYYKTIIAKNNKLKICIDISEHVTKNIKQLKNEQIKILCRLIGIYLDNAIEASNLSDKKLLAIEVYCIDDKLNFVFSNTFKDEEININKLAKKGYTTKGKGHGQGLYLANKILTKNKWLKTETRLANNLYIQKIVIKKDHL